jgi:hypothetical protein
MLLKSTLSSLPTYYLSLFSILVKGNFMWGIILWTGIRCVPPLLMGLGVQHLVSFNLALLAKWFWRFGLEETHLWRSVLVTKYGMEWGGWITKWFRGTHRCRLWKSIMMGWDGFAKDIEFDVCMGNRVWFWHDRWCGDRPLKEVFPMLFECSLLRDATVDYVLVRLRVGLG